MKIKPTVTYTRRREVRAFLIEIICTTCGEEMKKFGTETHDGVLMHGYICESCGNVMKDSDEYPMIQYDPDGVPGCVVGERLRMSPPCSEEENAELTAMLDEMTPEDLEVVEEYELPRGEK